MPPGSITSTITGMEHVLRVIKDLHDLGTKGGVAYIGTNLIAPPYPFYLEYGTRRMRAYPTARPAFDEKREEAYHTTADVLRQLIHKGRRDPEILLLALKAGALPIRNEWTRRVLRGPVPPHQRWGKGVTNLVVTGTYGRSISVDAKLVDDPGAPL